MNRYCRNTIQRAAAALSLALSVIVLLSFAVPLVAAISPLAGSTQQSGASEFHVPLLSIIIFTFKEALLSTALALMIGIPAGFLVAKRNFLGRKLLVSLSSVPLCIPSLIVALGYVSTFGRSGWFNQILMHCFHLTEPPITFLYSLAGIVFTQGFYNFPLIMMTVADTWSSLSTEQSDSALLLGASKWRVFKTITFFQILPAVVSSSIPVFLYCFFSFMIILLFGAPGCTTLEVALYHSARSTLSFKDAALIALVETCCAFIIVFVYTLLENKSSRLKGLSFSEERQERTPLLKKEILPASLFLFIIAVCFVTPLASIVFSSFCKRSVTVLQPTLSAWKSLFTSKDFFAALCTTLYTALATALICTVTSFVYALLLKIKDPFARHTFWRAVPILPMSVSSVVISLGMTLLVRRGSVITLILAQASLFWPFAFRQIYVPLSKMPDAICDAARLLSPYKLDAVIKIYIPYCAKGLVSAFGFCFALSAGDATIPLVLAIPHFDTLSLFTYRLAGGYHFNESFAPGIILGLLCALFFLLSNICKEKNHNVL